MDRYKGPLKLPDALQQEVREYYSNLARGWFPKPREFCIEDIRNESLKEDIGFESVDNAMWFFFWESPNSLEKYRCLHVNPENIEGYER
jgi:hypothetical protein